MRARRPSRKGEPSAGDPLTLPAGTPDWISPQLVEQTLRVWQPYSRQLLTVADAIEMILNVGRLSNALSRGDRHEAVRGVSPGEQPGTGT